MYTVENPEESESFNHNQQNTPGVEVLKRQHRPQGSIIKNQISEMGAPGLKEEDIPSSMNRQGVLRKDANPGIPEEHRSNPKTNPNPKRIKKEGWKYLDKYGMSTPHRDGTPRGKRRPTKLVKKAVETKPVRTKLTAIKRSSKSRVEIKKERKGKGMRSEQNPNPKISSEAKEVGLVYEGYDQYYVEYIISSRGSGRRRKYKVRWKGYGPESDSWVSAQNINREMRGKYNESMKTKVH
ncbi:hypothetical protein MMC10_003116 [Thelotrema lepadinum]|nr:hypothetical protein [Thelotrema lepadinum]